MKKEILMTTKLYDLNAYQTTFNANVLNCTKYEDKYDIILDQTCFFPEEGGQTCDLGTLNDIEVIDVQIKDQVIHHYTTSPLNGEVTGVIDFNHRYFNMQHHSAEHILSGIIHHYFQGNNVGFHLGNEEITADYDRTFTPDEIEDIENKVNEVIHQNLEIHCWYPDNINEINYRAKKEIKEAIRIVQIGDIDTCACCAPHVQKTSEIHLFKIIKTMKFKRGTRFYFICGNKALKDYQIKFKEAQMISSLLKAPANEIDKAVSRLYEEQIRLKQQLSTFKKAQVNQILSSIDKTNHLIYFEEDMDMNTQKYFVSKLHEFVDDYAAVFVKDKDSYRFILFSHNDATIYLKKLKEQFIVKGGGKKDAIQGSIQASKEQILEVLKL
ncbi:alanyl-tRNA editing protein [Floccifex sp.]|uniref:alanyl-tRNA editing protein n=1 Tax=Floccifex sp. TaxID=2815810 RepID=UPI003F0563E1